MEIARASGLQSLIKKYQLSNLLHFEKELDK